MKDKKEQTPPERFYFKARGENFQKVLDDKAKAGLVPVLEPVPCNTELRYIRWVSKHESQTTGRNIKLRGCSVEERIYTGEFQDDDAPFKQSTMW
jgi:hypothetical protein